MGLGRDTVELLSVCVRCVVERLWFAPDSYCMVHGQVEVPSQTMNHGLTYSQNL